MSTSIKPKMKKQVKKKNFFTPLTVGDRLSNFIGYTYMMIAQKIHRLQVWRPQCLTGYTIYK